MNKIYIGNLPQDIEQQSLCDAFMEHCNVELTGVVVNQKGFAFADCKDPVAADRAIEHMNGFAFNGGKEMSVEHSVPRGSRSRKVQVRHIPSHLNWEELDKLLAEFGTVDNCEQVSTESDTATVKVTYSTRAEAQAAIRDLNGKSVEGSILKVTLLPDSYDAIRQNRGARFSNGGNFHNGPFNNNQNYANRPKSVPELPTRMLVPSQLVGAIIGKGGESIRAITQKTHARIDVHRKDNPGATEKAITINGSTEACGAAVAAILEIVREEDRNARMAAGTWDDNEIPLKILAHNSLIGRLIGKEGRNLKAIQEKVDAKIAISNSMADMQQYNVERTIAIYGDNEKCAAAEVLLMEKLRSCYENDMMAAYQQPQHYPGLNMNQLNMFPGLHGGYPQRDPIYGMNNNYMNAPGYRNTPGFNGEGRGQESETCTLYIPSESVGAMIGTKGSHIRNISRIANASIKIVPPEEGDDEKQRRVTIMGNPEGQWKSQFCIFDKLKQEGFFNEQDEKLTSEMTIPASIVGRVIGKGGNNVRELQRLTSSEVVIPRQSETEGLEEVPVKIVGHFFAIQSAQRKIRELLVKAKEAERVGKMRPNNIAPPPVTN
uniref:Insulin-like growth factor 2 mRNA-binding protein 1 n=1 Tax=Phallusia mammillata TaxID=59560 RepID=A0A6F9DFA2_9ASCI|nr:insulin-like growth factor 2 mRNA-binding protein 1 [Phallusia mammillata]